MADPSDYTCVSMPHVDLYFFVCLCLEDHISYVFIYHYTYAYLCKNALYLCPSFSSFLPPTHTPHITSHSCAVLNKGDLLSGGETGKNMAMAVCTPQPKEMTEIEEAQESTN